MSQREVRSCRYRASLDRCWLGALLSSVQCSSRRCSPLKSPLHHHSSTSLPPALLLFPLSSQGHLSRTRAFVLLVLEQMSQCEAPTVGLLCFQCVPACQCHRACFHGRLDRGYLPCLSAVLCGLGMFGSLSTTVPVMFLRESGLQPQNLLGGTCA